MRDLKTGSAGDVDKEGETMKEPDRIPGQDLPAGFTPGPWCVIETGFGNPPCYLVSEDLPGRLRPICAAEHGHPKAEANAYLISAAPELLGVAMAFDAEMLRQFPAGPNGHPATLSNYQRDSWLYARAAIAKALPPSDGAHDASSLGDGGNSSSSSESARTGPPPRPETISLPVGKED